MPRFGSWLRAGLAAVCWIFGAAAVDAAPEDPYFRRGIQAIHREDYHQAESELLAAIEHEGQESRRKITISGGRYEWYLPFYFLGLARLHLGDLQGAHEAWSRSREQGVVLDWRDSERFAAEWNDLAVRLGPVRRRPAPAPTPAPKPAPTPAPKPAPTPAPTPRPTDSRSVAALTRDLMEVASRLRKELAGGRHPALADLLARLEVELGKNLPDRETLLRLENEFLRAFHSEAFGASLTPSGRPRV